LSDSSPVASVICRFNNEAFAQNHFAKLFQEAIAGCFTLHQWQHAIKQSVNVVWEQVAVFARNQIQESSKFS
jgi:hypothetical protein